MNVYEKPYMQTAIAHRQHEVNDQYYMYCRGVNETGVELTPASAAHMRARCKRDVEILQLVSELLNALSNDVELDLSESAQHGFEKLAEPVERHRQYRR